MKEETGCKHELVMPNEDLPFKLFLFEGKDGNYVRDRHWHRSIEIFAVFEGELSFVLGEEKLLMKAGSFVLVNSNEIHSIFAPKPNRTVVLQIPLPVFEKYFNEEGFIQFSHEVNVKDKKIMELVNELYETYESRECGYELKVQSGFFMLLYLLVTQYREEYVSMDLIRSHKKLNRLSTITSYIQENYQKDLSLESIAREFGYSPTYLSKIFQRYARINYKEYLQSLRVEHAYQELRSTDHTISQIALNHGFPNSKAFAKMFHRTYGMLPSEYRKL